MNKTDKVILKITKFKMEPIQTSFHYKCDCGFALETKHFNIFDTDLRKHFNKCKFHKKGKQSLNE